MMSSYLDEKSLLALGEIDPELKDVIPRVVLGQCQI